MLSQIAISIRMTIALLVLVCAAYPFAVWSISQAAFPRQANGSLIYGADGRVLGSSLLAQGFTQPQYFHPRPSAAGAGYDPTQSGGTNLGPTSRALIHGSKDFQGIAQLAAAYRKENGLAPNAMAPVDAVTRSASGLDPDIGIDNALLQAGRIAAARHVRRAAIVTLIHAMTIQPTLGLLGPPRVNVLALNLALTRRPIGR